MPAGEIVVLLGPSGCGKTTTLRCVAGLEHPTGGEISIGGKMVSSPARGILVPPRLRELGMVFQSYAVWPHMTVRQNVIYPLKHRKMTRAEANRKVDEVLELVGLSEYAERPVVALSGGQMQRVALARSIVYRPQLLLLDEPLSNLDAKLRLQAARRPPHHPQADRHDRALRHPRPGRSRRARRPHRRDARRQAAADRTPDQIYNRPADLFVANFTGATNELTGTLVGRNGEFGVVDFGGGHSGEAALLQSLDTGDKVRIALRPETIGLGRHDGINQFPARVVDRRYQGTQTVYDVELFGRRLEALELGTAARHQVGVETTVSLPREGCWAYRDTGASNYE